jgi:quercetin 2,3-dioxygenase
LQIWIEPKAKGKEPSYTEWHPTANPEPSPKVLVISPDGREGSAQIYQEASVYLLKIPAGGSVTHQLSAGRGLWLQVMRGSLMIDDQALAAGDGASAEKAGEFTFQSRDPVEALLFDLA